MKTSLLTIASSLMLVSGSMLYLINTRKSTDSVSHNDEVAHINQNIVNDRFRILNAHELIQVLDLSPQISGIKMNLGLSDENWSKDALPFLEKYIAFVQRLPASESHHHAGDGGLVRHTLDVAALALVASTSQSWPPNAKTEEIAKKTAVWRYGIMCAALLHDVGKTVTGFQVELFDSAISLEKLLWLPDTGSMAESGKLYYRVEFPDAKSAYSTHAEIAWTFFQALVPSHVRQWLATTDSNLMITLRNYLSGKKDGSPLEQLIKNADMTSVSRDLRSGSRQRFSTAKRKPFIETIMETLKEMLSDRGVHFSIATTAGGDLFRKGDRIYLMSKNVPDYIRQYLRKNQHPAAGSFPADNQRIFDTLFEYRAVIPPENDPHRAINHIEVEFTRMDGEKVRNIFSVLCFNAKTLYPDGDYPTEFLGNLSEVSAKKEIPDVVVSEDKVSTQIQGAEDNPVTMTKDKMDFLSIQPVTAEQPPLPEKNQTETANSAFDNSMNTAAPAENKSSESEKAKEPGYGTIDNLIENFNLIEADSEQTESTKSEAETAENAVNLVQENIRVEVKTETVDKPRAEVKETETDKAPKTIKSGTKASRKKLAGLFADNRKPIGKTAEPDAQIKTTETVTHQIDSEAVSLPESESAQNGMRELEQLRLREPTSSPRPVQVMDDSEGLDSLASGVKNMTELEAIVSERNLKKQSETESTEIVEDSVKAKHMEARDRGMQFLRWLADGLGDGSIAVNRSGATVHFIEQGMLLVTPAVFRDYAGGVFNKSDTESLGPLTQKGFEALRLHARTKKSSLHRVLTTNGSNRRLFYCYLIPEHNIKHIIQPGSRPQNNTDIKLDESDLLVMEQK
ncbi:TraI domain-containing protein [Neisseria gonorrhoeae]|uniref:MobH family relaxase n=2 Tax=Neisseria gonorrhoeae TaxID=485 RepID=UPI0005E1947D|nr:MobH family relaxase [Neisseria gonorrhoeae]MBG9971995.1 TraI domain-containing protein [Neisseria gonorrhoeae]MBG9975634.1 TraI domain-containing protein [Neisseria gonorrhoeae]MCF2988073.1 TraI domain-containing protein [Neisseria gonorrhoeae]MCF3006168.1 TraI domain-containing protein [Neisseria gonorrhoeae]MCH8705187.1 TraI domain-containing protein [Neisseria gonorrhoeae]